MSYKFRGCKYRDSIEGCTPDNCVGPRKCRSYNYQAGIDWKANNPEKHIQNRTKYYDIHRDDVLERAKQSYMPVGKRLYYLNQNGLYLKMRVLPEIYMAHILDDEGIDWNYQPGILHTPHGKYYPDYYIPKWDAYLEVKGKYWMSKNPMQLVRIKWLREQGIHIYMVDSKMITSEMKFRRLTSEWVA